MSKSKETHSEFDSKPEEESSLKTESDFNNDDDWVSLLTIGVLSIFAGVFSTGVIAGLAESFFEIELSIDNPIVRITALFLTIGWWKIIRYWDTSE